MRALEANCETWQLVHPGQQGNRACVRYRCDRLPRGSCSSIKAGRDVQVEGVELVYGTIRADVVIRQ